MSTQTEHFGVKVIGSIRDSSLYELNRLLGSTPPEDASAEVAAALGKLSGPDKIALRNAVAGIIDHSIAYFVHALDEAANEKPGLEISYARKPLSTGNYEFDAALPKWKDQFSRYDDKGAPNDKAFK
jgi:hypothetical protein